MTARPSLLLLAGLALGCTRKAPEPSLQVNDPDIQEPVGQPDDDDGIRVFIGQDVDSIAAYAQSVGTPQGVVGYTSLVALDGTTRPVDNGGGVNHLDALARDYPDAPIAVGLYLVDQLEDTVSGRLDDNIDELAGILAAYQRPVLLRIGYEFDGNWTHYEPDGYRASFRRIVERTRAQGADQVEFVWQSMAGCEPTFQNRPRTDWYPGDDVVDWVGVSWFVEPTACGFAPQHEMLDFAREHGKPYFIAEATPQRFDLGELTFSRDANPVTVDAIVARWFEPYWSFIEENADNSGTALRPSARAPHCTSASRTYARRTLGLQARLTVRAVTYINADWDAQAMWGPPYNTGYWGDSRLQADPDVLQQWLDRTSVAPWGQPSVQ